ncbi:MAG: LPP20 family lipoprotein [Fibrobacteria bacterium]|nr:LPP20 family lipoprotein [Fibrobacteria bacterium]
MIYSTRTFISVVLFFGLSLFFTGCAPTWIKNPPDIYHCFVAVGSADIGISEEMSKDKAIEKALKSISEQIRANIISEVKTHEKSAKDETSGAFNRGSEEKITLLTKEILKNWKLKDSWKDPKGVYWCMVTLDLSVYRQIIKSKIDSAIAVCTKALTTSKKGSIKERLLILDNAYNALDNFLGVPFQTVVNDSTIVLNKAVPGLVTALLGKVFIRPVTADVLLSGSKKIPDTLGVTVMLDSLPDSSLTLNWHISGKGVTGRALPLSLNRYPVGIRGLSPALGKVSVSATPDLYFFKNRMNFLQSKELSGAFTITRKKPLVYLAEENEFLQLVIEALVQQNIATKTDTKENAELVLGGSFVPQSDSVKTSSYTCELVDTSGDTFLKSTGNVGPTDTVTTDSTATLILKKVAAEASARLIEGI